MEHAQWANVALVSLAIVCYYNSTGCGFVFDDMSAVKDNKDLRPATPVSNLFWNDFWGTPMHKEKSHKSYRPLCVLTFRWNYVWSELEPYSYHLVNVLLHALVCLLFFSVCQMFLTPTSSFVAALLFTVHPIHTEAVTGVVGRAEMLSSIFYLSALMTYARCTGYRAKTVWWRLLLTVLLVSVAMLCKEQGITVVGVCCVYEVFVAQKMTLPALLDIVVSFLRGKPFFPVWLRDAVIRGIFLVGTTVCLLLARIKVMGAQLPVFTKFDNPASVAPVPSRQLTFLYLLPVNAWLLLFPHELCCDWTMGTVPLVESLLEARNLATLAFLVCMGKFVVFCLRQQGKRARAVIMCLALLVLPFIPASNLFFPVGFVVAERILYAPSMGFCMLVALGFELLINERRRLRPLLWLGMVLLLLTHSVKTVHRNRDWESEYTIFQAALGVNQRNAKLFNNVGHALENKKMFSKALLYFERAAIVQPDDIGAHINVGRTLNQLERYEVAEEAYRTALSLLPPIKPGQSYTARIAPSHLNVFINLGNLISKDDSRLMEADALYRTAISMRADYTQAYINRGDVLMRLNRTDEAQEQYETALRYENDNPDIYYNLAVVLLEQNKHQLALQNFERALRLDPDHKQTLFNSAVLMQELGEASLRPEAYRRLHKLLKVEPDNEKVYFNLAMLAMDEQSFDQAYDWFLKAIELKPDFRSALFNLALMLVNNLEKPLDAVPHLKELLKHHPHHTKGLILMGDININYLKDVSAAEQNFVSILSREPNNIQARHNLCVVYVEQGLLHKAEKCLLDTHQLAPHEDYILNHLNIVRSRIKQVEQQMKLQQQSSGNGHQPRPSHQQQPHQQQSSGNGHQPRPSHQQQPHQQQASGNEFQPRPNHQQQSHQQQSSGNEHQPRPNYQQQPHQQQSSGNGHQPQPSHQQQPHPSPHEAPQNPHHPPQQHMPSSSPQQPPHPQHEASSNKKSSSNQASGQTSKGQSHTRTHVNGDHKHSSQPKTKMKSAEPAAPPGS